MYDCKTRRDLVGKREISPEETRNFSKTATFSTIVENSPNLFVTKESAGYMQQA
jgi:hypothetical protein